MAKIRIDIPSGTVAGKLGNGYQMVNWGRQSFTLRRCYRNGEPSGGAVLTMRVNRDVSITGAKTRVTRLRKGWDEKKLAYAVFRLMKWVRENELLWITRQVLHDGVEKYDIPEDFEPPKGHNDDYQTMNLDDILFWEKYIPANFNKRESNESSIQ